VKKKLRVLALMHHYLVPPDDTAGVDVEEAEWRTEHDVTTALAKVGHDVRKVGVGDDLGVVRTAVSEWNPHIVFNLMESFHEVAVFDQHVVSYLELLRVPYTGCNPRGLMLSRDKTLSKTLLAYHRVPVPDSVLFRMGRAVVRPKRLPFPLIVKSRTQDASIGISQASVVTDDDKLRERVRFVHEKVGTDAVVERYIDGRELYVGLLGDQRVTVFPVWEMRFPDMAEGARRISTERVKWNSRYQQKHGITTGPAEGLPDGAAAAIQRLCKRVYRVLDLSGYARVDLRLDPEGRVWVLEANANPQLARGEDFAESAAAAGLSYEELLERILSLGLRWQPERLG
jgi:D-alanine-D-alanine ligase